VTGTDELAALIQSKKMEWGELWIEREIHATEDPHTIAETVQRWTHEHLGSGIRKGLLYYASVGSTFGVELTDGRRVVIKGHRHRLGRAFLVGKQQVQAILADEGFPCPTPLAGPASFGRGNATAERWLDAPPSHDGHDPVSIRGMAKCLAALLKLSHRLALSVPDQGWAIWSPDQPDLWPEPHSELFDFSKPLDGQDAIEAVAAAAMGVLKETRSWPVVLGHGDICPQNARFDPRVGEVVAVFDWDSISMRTEAFFVGTTASSCTADWSTERVDRPRHPSFQEAREFLSLYEAARGEQFTRDERRAIGAQYAYATAYNARLGDDLQEGTHFLASGTINEILAHGLTLLDL